MNECILVVDDDAEIVGAIAITLEREGYRCLKAYDGLQAMDLCLDPAVKLILIDVMMPRLDGLSALMRIREKRNLPVIVLSAKSEDSDKILGLSMGADDYVTKPFNPQELLARVKSQLRRYTQLGDVHAQERAGGLVNGRLTYDPESRQHAVYSTPDLQWRGLSAAGCPTHPDFPVNNGHAPLHGIRRIFAPANLKTGNQKTGTYSIPKRETSTLK